LKRSHDEEGFTLLELMVVVAIIAIIASILVPNFFHARAQAAVSACEQNIRSISTAAELYYTDNQAYPAASPVDTTSALYTGKFLTQTPRDPAAPPGAANVYQFSGANANGGYTITCPGAHQGSALAALNNNAVLQGNHPIGYGSSTGFKVDAPDLAAQ